ncbi:MAG: hypothetical protein K0S65_1200, partial [Labilithrix sp.]|nr:hypothetical protein [Labilithrix sp.]
SVTNGAGVARVGGLAASFGSARLVSAAKVREALEPRWEAYRPVRLPQGRPRHRARAPGHIPSRLTRVGDAAHPRDRSPPPPGAARRDALRHGQVLPVAVGDAPFGELRPTHPTDDAPSCVEVDELAVVLAFRDHSTPAHAAVGPSDLDRALELTAHVVEAEPRLPISYSTVAPWRCSSTRNESRRRPGRQVPLGTVSWNASVSQPSAPDEDRA